MSPEVHEASDKRLWGTLWRDWTGKGYEIEGIWMKNLLPSGLLLGTIEKILLDTDQNLATLIKQGGTSPLRSKATGRPRLSSIICCNG